MIIWNYYTPPDWATLLNRKGRSITKTMYAVWNPDALPLENRAAWLPSHWYCFSVGGHDGN